MPIIDVEMVLEDAAAAPPSTLARALADAIGRTLGSAPGCTWVRLRSLPAAHYAENDALLGADEWPVFVTVLHAHPPTGDALAAEAAALTAVTARTIGCPPARVHVQYAPPGAGRQAFGGHFVE